MFKALSTSLLFGLFSLNTMASEVCSDRASLAVQEMRSEVEACGTQLPTEVFDKVVEKLNARSTLGYNKGVIMAMLDLQKLIYGEVYEYGLQDDHCLKAVFSEEKKMKAEVMDALIMCSF